MGLDEFTPCCLWTSARPPGPSLPRRDVEVGLLLQQYTQPQPSGHDRVAVQATMAIFWHELLRYAQSLEVVGVVHAAIGRTFSFFSFG